MLEDHVDKLKSKDSSVTLTFVHRQANPLKLKVSKPERLSAKKWPAKSFLNKSARPKEKETWKIRQMVFSF